MKKLPLGRPTKRTPKITAAAAKLAAQGKSKREISEALNINRTTLRNWCLSDAEFLTALKEGEKKANDLVEASVFHRACGYSCPEVKIFVHDGEVIEVDTIKHYPPDMDAAKFWLTNRDPARWKHISSVPPDPNHPHDQEAQIKALTDWYREVKEMK